MIGSRPEDVAAIAECYGALRAAVGGVVVGQESAVRLAFITLLSAAAWPLTAQACSRLRAQCGSLQGARDGFRFCDGA